LRLRRNKALRCLRFGSIKTTSSLPICA
jgi:hypothetical protein